MIRDSLTRSLWQIALGVTASLSLTLASNAQPAADQTRTTEPSRIITGRISMADGEPVSSASVQISALAGAEMSETVRADASGSFKSSDLRPGLYRVSSYLPGYVPDGTQPNQGLYHPGDTVSLRFTKGGVITGTVTNSTNNPVVAITVRAQRVRDQDGKPILFVTTNNERLTDDRGVYRLYGLLPGTYLVSAGGSQRNFGVSPVTAYENDAPTYAPSSTRDTAAEITINRGDEVTADIQYRGEAGHAVSGTVAGTDQFQGQVVFSAAISLVSVRTREQFMNGSASSFSGYGFAFYGVPDGEYELSASLSSPGRDLIASPPKRIKVQGGDVSGINLVLAPLASVSGRVTFETDPKNACGKRRASVIAETVIFGRRLPAAANVATPKSAAEPVPLMSENAFSQSILDANGGFSFKNLRSGSYLVEPREPASGWYVRSISFEPTTTNIPRDGVTVRTGERVSGVVVTITEGAAKLNGRVTTAEGQSRPSNLRVYLVPTERAASENVLRFFEARVETEGNFVMDNVTPGKYWIVARPAEETDFGIAKTVRQDGAFRAKVLHDAETLTKEIAFKPCEQVVEYSLPLTTPSTQP